MKIKDYLKCILSLFIFFFTSLIVVYFVKYVLNINYKGNYLIIAILDFIVSFIIAILVLFVNFKLVKEDIRKKINMDYLIEDIIVFFAIKFGLSILSSFISNIFGVPISSSDNQELIDLYFKAAPALMVISASIFAPVSEELVFRGNIRSILKNKKVFVIVSGLIFGLMHITDNLIILFTILLIGVIVNEVNNKKLSVILASLSCLISLLFLTFEYGSISNMISLIDLNEVINSIVYIGMGIYLAYIYTKRDNIVHNMLIHGFNNAFSMVISLFL